MLRYLPVIDPEKDHVLSRSNQVPGANRATGEWLPWWHLLLPTSERGKTTPPTTWSTTRSTTNDWPG